MGREFGQQQGCRHPVLIADQFRGDAVAQGLLIAEGQTWNPGNPFEAGQGGPVGDTGTGSDP